MSQSFIPQVDYSGLPTQNKLHGKGNNNMAGRVAERETEEGPSHCGELAPTPVSGLRHVM